MMLFTRPQWALPFGSITPTYLPAAIAVKILLRLLLCLVISLFSLVLSILSNILRVSILYACLENRTITTNTIHDATDTVQIDTFAHILHERGRVSMASNQPANNVLHLDRHFFSLLLCCSNSIYILSACQ